jgi:hypothetical protein
LFFYIKELKDMSDENVTEEFKEHVKDSSVWTRLLFMALFATLYWVAEVVLAVVVLFQFLSVLLTGNKNEKVLTLGAQLSTYAYQIFSFLTYNSEEKPFPMSDWPSGAELSEQAAKKTAAPVRKRAPAKKRAPAAKAKTDAKEEGTAS